MFVNYAKEFGSFSSLCIAWPEIERTFSDVISVTEDYTALSICGSPPIIGLIKLLCFSLEEKY